MLEDFRDLEQAYSERRYPYLDGDNEYSQQRLRQIGAATDQLMQPVTSPPTPTPAPNNVAPPATLKSNKTSIIVGVILLFVLFKLLK